MRHENMCCCDALYDGARSRINWSLMHEFNREMTLEDALGAVEGTQRRRRVLHLTSKLLLAIDRQRHLQLCCQRFVGYFAWWRSVSDGVLSVGLWR